VRALEAIIGQQRMPATGIPGGPPVTSDATSAEGTDKGQVLLKLSRWSASYGEGQYSQYYYAISYTLVNNYNKPVKLINGSIGFFDLVGERIIGIKLERDVKIEPGKEASFRGNYGINQFINSEMRLKDLAPEDVRAQLEVKKIVFRDNTIIDLK
jgi:hypothetical protein